MSELSIINIIFFRVFPLPCLSNAGTVLGDCLKYPFFFKLFGIIMIVYNDFLKTDRNICHITTITHFILLLLCLIINLQIFDLEDRNYIILLQQ